MAKREVFYLNACKELSLTFIKMLKYKLNILQSEGCLKYLIIEKVLKKTIFHDGILIYYFLE